jgi:hypothetical protein
LRAAAYLLPLKKLERKMMPSRMTGRKKERLASHT